MYCLRQNKSPPTLPLQQAPTPLDVPLSLPPTKHSSIGQKRAEKAGRLVGEFATGRSFSPSGGGSSPSGSFAVGLRGSASASLAQPSVAPFIKKNFLRLSLPSAGSLGFLVCGQVKLRFLWVALKTSFSLPAERPLPRTALSPRTAHCQPAQDGSIS